MSTANFHLPGAFEFFELYNIFLPLFRSHREYFYSHADIASVYGAPADCIWGGGRFGGGEDDAVKVLSLLQEYNISARLTFSNSLLRPEHLSDRECNDLCRLFDSAPGKENGVIVHSDILADHIRKNYRNLYLVSSTTKVITEHGSFFDEIRREEFRYVVADFRLNMQLDKLDILTYEEKAKAEFLCNECCSISCRDRKECYENVSRRILGEDTHEHICTAPNGSEGYLFSKAMKNPSFIGTDDILGTYLPRGFSEFKIEGRGLGSAIVLEFLLYYLVKPEYRINVREKIYLDSMLDLF